MRTEDPNRNQRQPQQTEFQNYQQTDIPYFCLTCAYVLSGCRKMCGNQKK